MAGFVDKGIGGFDQGDFVTDGFEDFFALSRINNQENYAWQGRDCFTNNNFLVPLFFEPKIGELIPDVELAVGTDTTGRDLVFGVFGLVCGEDIGEESKGHDDADQEEFFEEEEDHAEEESDREDGGVELAGADFVGPCGSGPLSEDFFDFDVFGDFAGFCLGDGSGVGGHRSIVTNFAENTGVEPVSPYGH